MKQLLSLIFAGLTLPALAQTWTGQDIGSVGAAGSDSYNSSTGVYTIQGSGADINGTADAFHFVYQTLTADGELEARVATIQNAASGKAGIMIRQSTDAGSINAAMLVTPTAGINFQQRTAQAGTTSSVETGASAPPYWVRIIKDGSRISVYQSPDGVTWTYAGETVLTLTSPVEIGFAVTSHNAGALCTATFDNITLTAQTTFAPQLPWRDQDIGSPGQAGQVHVEENLWSIFAGGAGIIGSSDTFHYTYQALSGNGVAIAQVNGMSASTASGGVVMRQDLTPGAAEAGVLLNSTSGITFATRTTAGGTVSSANGAAVIAPYWVKLVRAGNVFYGYQSPDGLTWTLVGTQTINMTGTIYVGVGATSGNNSITALAILDRVWVIPGSNYLLTGGVVCGAYHNLYLQANGNVWAWGLNTNGQIGDGTTTQRNGPVQLSSLSAIEAVSAGASHSLALQSDGSVWVWGNNANGQLGDGTTTQHTSPEHLTTLSGIMAISAGASHTLALKNDGTVWVWGNNANGELGDGTVTQHTSPEQLTSLSGIVAISAGGSHSLALRDDGAVFAWGNNSSGQIGDGTTTQRTSPVQVTSVSNAQAVSAGFSHSLMLADGGSVCGWGDNSAGEIGDGTTTQRNSPVQIPGLTSMSAVQASNLFSLALRSDGTIWAWGSNASGQLGNGNTTGQTNPGEVMNIIAGSMISAGTLHSMAIESDASIWSWGDNSKGQLGNGTTVSNLVPQSLKPVITSVGTASGTVGSPFNYTITASCSPISYNAASLPAGLSVNTSTGVISGTPTAVGTYYVALSATTLGGTGTATLTLTVAPPPLPVITSSTVATGNYGVAFNYTITATNGPTSFGAVGLPAGLSVGTSTGVISGIPAAKGVFSIILSAKNAGGTGTAGLTLTINPPPPVISSATVATGTTGVAFSSYTITAINYPTSYNAVGLPAGLSVSTTTGAITGTPTTAGTSSVTLSATNAGGTGTATLTFTINSPKPAITSGATATATLGVAYSGYTITGSNSPAGFSATGLPPGLSLNATTGAISGTPTTVGTFTVTIGATNAAGTGTATLTFTVNPVAPVITSATTATGIKSAAFSGYTITANNNPTSFNATGLPAGLSVSTSTGAITGTPTATGTSSVTLSAINAGGTGTATLTFTINSPTPVISSATTATGTTGSAFSYTIAASNTPTSFVATGLPAGLSLNATSGAITGTPTTVGTFAVTLGAVNATGTGTATLTLTINAPKPIITSLTTASATVGVVYGGYSITATNTPTSYSATGLPAGLSVITTTGKISGTPTTAGISSVTLGAINANGTGTATLTFTVLAPKPVISSATTVTGTVGSAFSGYSITATNSPTSYSAEALPAGLSVSTSTGAITGTPTTAGTFTTTVGAANANGTGTATLTFTINQPTPVINSPIAATGTIGVAISTYSITASNNPTSYSATGLPAGLSVSTTTGKITGTPTTVGTSSVSLGATNATGTGTATLTFTINPAKPVITSPTTAGATKGVAFSSYTIIASNSPTSYSATGLPAGLGVSTSTGAITGTPTTTGTSTVTLGATNASGTGNATLTFTIASLAVPVISSPLTDTGTTGVAISTYSITASNTPTSYNATGLPAGLSVVTSTGKITGTPTAIGSFPVTISATNSNGTGTADLVFTITAPKPVISSATTANGTMGVAFSNYTITASNGPTSYNATGLPAGLSVSTASGAITGTPTTTGTSSVALSAINAGGTGTATLTFTINAPVPVISSPTTATGTIGTAFSGYTVAASNIPTSFSASGLPAGLVISSSTGAITGTPTVVGTSTVKIGATNASGTGTATLTFTVNSPTPVITSATTAIGIAGTAFNSYTITANNTPASFGATGLPAGLSVSASTGAISGTPTTLGTSTVALGATNATGTGTTTLTFTINSPKPVISSPTTFTAIVGASFSGYAITATNSPTSYGATNLPAGLSVNTGTGAITGTPTVTGTFAVTIGATNTTGTGTATLTLTVNSPTPVITSSISTVGTSGVAFSSYAITATNAPTSYSATGLPAGISVSTSTGKFTGTPSATGTSTVTLGAANATGTGSATLSFTINPAQPVISSGTTTSGTLGAAFSGYTIAATNTPTSFSATGLPAGLVVNSATGAITGTPTVAGTFSVTVGAANITGTGTATLTLTITPLVPAITSATTASGATGVAFKGYTATASNVPTSYSASGLPSGLSINALSGEIDGTPTVVGTFTVTLGATNAGGTGNGTLTLTITNPTPVVTSAAAVNGLQGVAFTYQITASNTPTSYGAIGLPSGLSVNTATGAITGSPTIAGTSIATLSATNAGGTGAATLTITISVPPPVTSGMAAWYEASTGITTSGGSVTQWSDQSLNQYNVTGSGASAPTVGTDPATNLPVVSFNGSQLLSTSAQIAGVNDVTIFTVGSAPNAGDSGVQVQVGAGYGSSCSRGLAYIGGNQAFTNGINSSGYFTSVSGGPAVQTAALTTNTVTYSASGSLASFYSNGIANGTASIGTVATAAGLIMGDSVTYDNYYNWTGNIAEIIVYNRVLSTSERQQVEAYLGNKYGVQPVITSASSATGTTGVGFNYTITASDGATSYGATGLPVGLSINSATGAITGAPSVAGTFTVTLSATNSGGTVTAPLTLTIFAALPPVIGSPTTATATVGLSFSYAVTGNNLPTSFNAVGLPPGLSINTVTGGISGTPTAPGTSTVALSATNAFGTGTATLTLTVFPSLPVTSGLAGWFNASTGVMTTSGSVTQWNDLSGNSNNVTQVASSNAPSKGIDTATGQSVVAFNGSQYLNSNAQVNATNDVTIITVASTSVVNTGNDQTLVTVGNAYNSSSARISAYHGGTMGYEDGTNVVNGGPVPQNTLLTVNTVTYSQTGGLASFFTQGLANGTATASSSAINAGLTLGSSLDYIPWSAWNGNMAEVVVYNRVLSTTERQQVELYLANKYDIYAPGASWISSYTATVQAEINRNLWNKSQADAYVSFQANNPTVLTNGLRAWYKADSGVSQTGGAVTTWADQTGNYPATQTNSSNQPTFVAAESSGGVGLHFNGSQWLFNPASLGVGLNQDSTIIAVASTPSPQNNQYITYLGNQAGTSCRSLAYLNSDQAYDLSNGDTVTGAPGLTNTWAVEAGALNSAGTSVTFYRNGTASGTSTLSQAAQPLSPGITIGAYNNGGASYQGDLSELLIYDHQLSAAELQQVSIYLADKYGLYTPGATWIESFPTPVQAEINYNQWNEKQANAYVAFQNANPSMLTNGLLAWLKADSGVTTSGTNVTTWADQTGNYSVTQNTAANQPTLVPSDSNGVPALRFNGSQFLNNANGWGQPLAGDMTIITVGMTTQPTFQEYSAWLGSGGTDANRSIGYSNSSEIFDAGSDLKTGAVAPTTGVFNVEAVELNSNLTSLTYYRNGSQTATASYATPLQALTPGLVVGAVNGGGYGWYGDISEVLVYNHQLSAGELQQVGVYLADKYGLYNPNATWPLAYSSAIQAQITANQWNESQAAAYVNILQTIPVEAGLMAWYRGDNGVASSSGTVTTWQDSGIYRQDVTQATTSNQPTVATDPISGKPVVHFNGSQYLQNGNSFSSATDLTIVTVASTPVPGNGPQTQISIGQGYQSTGERSFLYENGKQSFSPGSRLDASTIFYDGGPAPQTTALVANAITYSNSSGTLSYYSNSVANGSVQISTTPVTSGIALGSDDNYGAFLGWNGNIAEVLVYNRVLSATELQQLQTYLAQKYTLMPVLTGAATALGTVGVPFNYTPTIIGVPTTCAATGLPAGLSINLATGVISGTPTATGTSTITLSATNAGGTSTLTIALTVNPALPPVINSSTNVGATVGEPFNYTITTLNTPVSFTATGLPAGLGFNTATGVISGTPTATGASTIALSAINGSGTGTATLTLTITPALSVTSGLQAWFRAESGIVANAGGLVSQWTDQTANGIVASNSTQANQPTLVSLTGGEKALSFSGSQDLFSTTLVPNINDVTIITVASANSPTTTSAAQVTLGYNGNPGSRNLAYASGNQTSGPITGGPVPNSSSPVINDVTYNHTTNSVSLYSQGQANGTGTYNLGTLTPDVMIGGYLQWQGNISEILVFDHVLTTSDRQSVEGYLGDKYGIYSPYATWVQQYSSTIQALIAANYWNRVQASAYAAFAAANPQIPASGLDQWLEADQGTVLSSGAVTTWQDQTWYHNDASQTTQSSMPSVVTNALAGHSVIQFNGTSQSLVSPAPASNVPGTFFVVYTKPTTGGTVGQDVVNCRNPAGFFNSLTVNPPTSNGGSVGSNRTFEADQVFSTSTTNYPMSLALGAEGAAWNNYFQGNIAEVMVYNRALTGPEQSQVNQYLADKYQFYSPSATWPESYSVAVQAEITANNWNEAQANAYVAMLATSPSIPTTGLGVWLRADKGVSVDGSSNVTSWQDQGCNENNAVTTGTISTEPQLVPSSLNGQPVIRFSGNQYLHILDDPSLTPATAYTIFSVARTNAGTTQSIVSKPWSSANYNSPYSSYGLGINSAGAIQSTQTTLTQQTDTLSSATPLTAGQAFLAFTAYDGTTQQVEAQGHAGSAAYVSGGLDYGDGSEKDVTVGAASTTAPQNYFNGDIAELIIYRRALSPLEMQQVGQYLATKYGVSYSSLSPLISPAGGSYGSSVSVSISGALTGQTIHYTIDGTTPTSASPLYSAPVTLTGSALVQAAFFSGSQLIGVTSSDQFYVNDVGQTGLAAAPSSVQATLASSSQISLSWTLNGMKTYSAVNVYRQVNGGGFVLLTTLGSGATSFTDSSVLQGNSYAYQVGTANASGVADSTSSSSVTDTSIPTQVITLTQPANAIPLP